MAHKIRVILDHQEDIFRDIVITSDMNLEDLHQIISNAFTLNPQEMAAFYFTDDEWNQKEEIPLMAMEDTQKSMLEYSIKDVLPENNKRLLYINDFLHMWTFYVEVFSTEETETEFPEVVLSYGNMPTDAPEKYFVRDGQDSQKSSSFTDDIFDDEEEDQFYGGEMEEGYF